MGHNQPRPQHPHRRCEGIPLSSFFLGIGYIPNAKFFTGQMDLDEDGYIRSKDRVFTTHNGQVIPGFFCAGDVQDGRYRQTISVAGSGCIAALEVEKYLEEQGL